MEKNPINIAHIDGGRIQTLDEHLEGTAALCERFTEKIGICGVGEILGILHDLGKATEKFNSYILDENSGISRGEIDHSTAGAKYLHTLKEKFEKNDYSHIMAIEMMELAIVSHHSGLIDCLTIEGEDRYSARMGKDDCKIQYSEVLSRINKDILDRVDGAVVSSINSLSKKIETIFPVPAERVRDGGYFRLGLLSRYLLSALVDADRIDTISFMDGRRYEVPKTDWKMLLERFDGYLSKFSGNCEISKIRRKISEQCLNASVRKPGLYTLTVPTGGGKTLSGFRFALNHLIANGMDRIFYVVPYLTIIEQNADVIRNALERDSEDNFVTECHSNVDVGADSKEESTGDEEPWKSPVDSWDSPIVMTSMVQFLETLFSSGTKRVRRMHNLANAVIIFDEIQSLPVKTVYMFNEAVSFLTEQCGSTVVLCTATQPLLNYERLVYPLDLDKQSEITEDTQELFESLKRTEIVYENREGPAWTTNEFCESIVDEIGTSSSILAVVNTKKMAQNLYKAVCETVSEEVCVYHLSTNMCAVHRKKVLDEIRGLLGKSKVICISTQLIEAGVDIDFETVFRSMAGLDSIAQAAGRCNRNAERDIGYVHVVRTDEAIGSLVDIDKGRESSELILARCEDILNQATMREYYERYFFKRENEMGYRTSNGDITLFGILSKNIASLNVYKIRHGNKQPGCSIRQAFACANGMFKVIDTAQTIVVPYDEVALTAQREYFEAWTTEDRRFALRKLQRYTVSTFNLDRLIRDDIVYTVDNDVWFLKDGYYDEAMGLNESGNLQTLML